MQGKMEKVKEFTEKNIRDIASILEMPVAELERESLRVYLENRLAQVESRLAVLQKRYGVKSSAEMERLYRERKLNEEGTWEDFFRFDHLEAERESLHRALMVAGEIVPQAFSGRQ